MAREPVLKISPFSTRPIQYEPSARFCGGHHCKVGLSEFGDQKTFSSGIWCSESICCKVCPSCSIVKAC